MSRLLFLSIIVTESLFEPSDSMESVMLAVLPIANPVAAMTAATPIITPSIVRNERPLLLNILVTAIFNDCRKFISSPPHHVLSFHPGFQFFFLPGLPDYCRVLSGLSYCPVHESSQAWQVFLYLCLCQDYL